MLNRLPIKLKLAIAVSIPVIALLIFAGAGLGTLSAVRIGGDNYNRIVDGKDVVADILPPPLYLVEAFLTVEQLARVDSRTEQELLRTRLTQLFAEYEDRHAYWLENLDASSGEEAELRRALTQDAYAPGAQLIEVVRTRFLPAVERGLVTGDMSEPRALVDGELESLYEQHRAYIDQVVPLAELRVANVETSTRAQVRNNLVLLGLTLAAVIAVAVTIAASMARAIVRPITQLRRAVNDVAEVLTDVDLDADAPALSRVELDSSQELTEAASSFNTLIDTTGELLARQARGRRNLGEVFQNLGRRNQGMLNRSLSLITKLERNQRDAAVLEDLFRLDHLATRMRRNAENLLVLAGSGSARPAARPAQIGDVVRGALSEIEEFTKVARPDLEPIGVKASAVADLTHLVAELVENASSFSPPDTQVQVRGGRETGGYLLSIIDEGLGMKADALERANERIEHMARLDLAPTATLGLYVVGRLAERHGISVRLTEGPLRGVVAKVFIPDVLLLDAAALEAGDPAARPAQTPLGAAAAGPEPEA
ncbi:MAG: ATP-binding protein, partial [Acidimicrobiales bacterium]